MPKNDGGDNPSNFIDKIVKDPNNPPDTLLLQGYLGASSEEGHTRLYLDPNLSDYVEIPSDAILHTVEIPKDQSPLGGNYVWINRDAEVTHGKVGSDRKKAKFLDGRIQQDFQSAAQAQAGVANTTAPNCNIAPSVVCATNICVTVSPIACHTFSPICHTLLPPCPSVLIPCQSVIHPCIPPSEIGPGCVVTSPVICRAATGLAGCGGVGDPGGPVEAFAARAPGLVSVPPCSGVQTQCCPISHPPCSGVQTQCCPISHPPCSGVQTQCCPISHPP